MWQRFSFSKWLGRDGQTQSIDQKLEPQEPKPGLGRRLSRRVVPGLPRPGTFRRQNSERRERLTPVEPSVVERRTVSVDRRRALSARPTSIRSIVIPTLSAPEVGNIEDGNSSLTKCSTYPEFVFHPSDNNEFLPPPPPPPPPDLDVAPDEPAVSEVSVEEKADDQIKVELEEKWILNLSMHFRDQSPREKFFVTYAETPWRWRRVTVSCDYRDAPIDSLERDLQGLQYQRDKSARIYESIRLSLSEIQFYETVTNLKLETKDDRLHVHVTEDTNEIIPYPVKRAVSHLDCEFYPESDLNFISHMSGFVYKVKVNGQICIKKEIPGPDSVDEFLYEINALHALIGSTSVINFQGLVVDEGYSVIKGLLIGFADQGALVDLLYDMRDRLPWARRERWAKQIVQGLSEIHEAGFVQGDFTLSNIVIDELDDAKIIDINRRGCPMGWEPPEISSLIESSQRISMYIGVKSDLFQLGMVLWALAEGEDEPERQPRPLSLRAAGNDIPQYFRNLVETCLSPSPKHRLSAKDLLFLFPDSLEDYSRPSLDALETVSVTSDQQSIDPDMAVEREDLQFIRNLNLSNRDFSTSHTYIDRPDSIELPFDGPGSYMINRRGRHPPANISHLIPRNRSRIESPNHHGNGEPQIVPVSPTGEHKWEEVEMDGTPYLIQRDSLDFDDLRARLSNRKNGGLKREFEHVDSGLADMDLAGVGGHEALLVGEDEDGTPKVGEEICLEAGPNSDDRHDEIDTAS